MTHVNLFCMLAGCWNFSQIFPRLDLLIVTLNIMFNSPVLLAPQASERVPLPMPSQQQAWCTQWPTPAPWANWRRAAVTKSGEGTRRPFALNCTVYNWRPSTGGRVWYMASWSTSLLTFRDPKTPGSGAAAALMWNLARSSQGTFWMPEKPTGTSMPVWGCITIELGDRWVETEMEVRAYGC